MARKGIEIHESSGNVFTDLGLENAEELLARATLAAEITKILRERRLTQVQAGKVLGVDQPKISALYRGHFDRFSLERLIRFVNALQRDVRIVIEPKTRRRKGKLIVEAA
jgi:predicted XRE-type DNA-binding protein